MTVTCLAIVEFAAWLQRAVSRLLDSGYVPCNRRDACCHARGLALRLTDGLRASHNTNLPYPTAEYSYDYECRNQYNNGCNNDGEGDVHLITFSL